MPQDGELTAEVSDYQQLARFIMETKTMSAEERILEGIREALEEAHARMKYATHEYERLSTDGYKEFRKAEKIRKSIMALLMERW